MIARGNMQDMLFVGVCVQVKMLATVTSSIAHALAKVSLNRTKPLKLHTDLYPLIST